MTSVWSVFSAVVTTMVSLGTLLLAASRPFIHPTLTPTLTPTNSDTDSANDYDINSDTDSDTDAYLISGYSATESDF